MKLSLLKSSEGTEKKGSHRKAARKVLEMDSGLRRVVLKKATKNFQNGLGVSCKTRKG